MVRKSRKNEIGDGSHLMSGKALYKKGQFLAVSINPLLNTDYYKQSPEVHVTRFYTYWSRILPQFFNKFYFKIESSWYGKLHLHGVVWVDDPLAVSLAIGKIKYVRGEEICVKKADKKWLEEYCLKDCHYNDKNIFTINTIEYSEILPRLKEPKKKIQIIE